MNKKESTKNFFFQYSVLPAYNINEELIYCHENKLQAGTVVKVQIRKKIVLACIQKKEKEIKKYDFKIKRIFQIYPSNIIDKETIDFIKWISDYNYVNKGLALKLFLGNEKFLKNDIQVKYSYKATIFKSKETKKKMKILSLLKKKSRTHKELLKYLDVSKPYLEKILKESIISKKTIRNKVDHNSLIHKKKLKPLNVLQQNSYAYILEKMKINNTKPILLDGITGSGKTEIYFKIIQKYLNKNGQILVLLPEIALSIQWIKRFEEAFGFLPLVWHSNVKLSEKNKVWQYAINKDSFVLVGTRSALFLPFKKLDLVIVDEENDNSYKQEEKIIYNARDMAILRGKLSGSKVLLVSATPSLETFYNTKINKYFYTKINKRYGIAELPNIKVIEMNKVTSNILASETRNIISSKLENKDQILILINRRGYSPVSLCRKCGHTINCENCDIKLSLHIKKNILLCHQCGFSIDSFSKCKKCDSSKNIIRVGYGIEKVYELIDELFPSYKKIMLSSDNMQDLNFQKILNNIEKNKIKIIIGTQIISKGFDFQHLDNVFILDFDSWFYNSDLRIGEKIFQLTTQIAGRAGRQSKKGNVYIQSYNSNNKVLDNIVHNKRDTFYKYELELRKKTKLPPYTKLVAIILSGANEKIVRDSSIKIKSLLNEVSIIKTFGPIPAPIKYLKNKYRYRLLLKSEKQMYIQHILKKLNLEFYCKKKVNFKVDVDPYNFF